ncbi:hypothetical protein IJT93_06600 [bacterium]|nr:hypothetical protein [bacterium]
MEERWIKVRKIEDRRQSSRRTELALYILLAGAFLLLFLFSNYIGKFIIIIPVIIITAVGTVVYSQNKDSLPQMQTLLLRIAKVIILLVFIARILGIV